MSFQPQVSHVVAVVAALALRELPSLLGKYFGKGVDLALQKGSPELDSFVLSAAKLAEKAIPAPGSGDEKYKLVAHMVTSSLPQLKLSDGDVDAAIEKAVGAMENEVDKRQDSPAPQAVSAPASAPSDGTAK